MSLAVIPILSRKSRSITRLDRLRWTAGLAFKAFGVRIGIRTNSPDLLKRLIPFLPAGWKQLRSRSVDRLYSLRSISHTLPAGSQDDYHLYGDTRTLAKTRNLQTVIETFEHDVNFHIAKTSQHLLFVHAGAIGWKGKAVVFPGVSFRGKTSLTREFLLLGAEYYSDEFAVLDARGRVHAFPRRLCIRDAMERQSIVDVKELGAKVGKKPLPLALLVVTRFKPGATWQPRLKTSGAGILELFGNSVSARSYPERAMAAFERAVSGALILEGPRGDAKVTAESILRILDRIKSV